MLCFDYQHDDKNKPCLKNCYKTFFAPYKEFFLTHPNFKSIDENVKNANAINNQVGRAINNQKYFEKITTPWETTHYWKDKKIQDFKIDLEKIDRLYYIYCDEEGEEYDLVCRMQGEFYINMRANCCISSAEFMGCDSPAKISDWPTSSDEAGKSFKGLRTPVTPSLRPPKPQRNQRRKYAWRNSSHTDVCMCICMLKSSKEEEVKCLGSLNVLNTPPLRQLKMMTSLSSRMQKAGERNSLASHQIREDINNSEIGLDIHKGSNMDHNNLELGLKSKRKKQEVASRREQPKSYDVMDDDIMTSSDTTDNTSESRGDKLVARKSRQEGKNILLYSVEDFLKWLLISFQTSSLVVLLLTIVTNVTNGLVNIRPQERITLIGNSANFLSAVVNSSTVILSFLLMIQLHKLAILTAIFYRIRPIFACEIIRKALWRA